MSVTIFGRADASAAGIVCEFGVNAAELAHMKLTEISHQLPGLP
jgi:hypothetical protein